MAEDRDNLLPVDRSTVHDIVTAVTDWSGKQSARVSRLERQLSELIAKTEERFEKIDGNMQFLNSGIQRLELSSQTEETATRGLAEVVGSLHRVLMDSRSANSDVNSDLRKVELVLAGAEECLEKAGLEQVPGEGAAYNPNWHQIIKQRPGPKEMEGLVVEVIRPGYRKEDALTAVSKALVAIGVSEG